MKKQLPHKEAETVRRRWTPDQLETMRVLIVQGRTNDEVSHHLKRAKGSVQLAVAVIGSQIWPHLDGKQIVAERLRLRMGRTDTPMPSPDRDKFASRYQTETQPVRREARKCLGGCGNLFMSAHKFNRICDNCSTRACGVMA